MALSYSDPSPDGANVVSVPAAFSPSKPARQVYVGTGGILVLKALDGAILTFRNIPNAGVLAGWFITDILAGTTASDIVVGF